MLRAFLTATSLLALCAAASAETTLLAGGHVIDVARGTVMKDHDILIEDGRIKAVGRAGTLGASGAAKVDMQGAFLLPARCHLWRCQCREDPARGLHDGAQSRRAGFCRR
jgi:cytosine/adenosine deaminase-related metal-dependent hydrolase